MDGFGSLFDGNSMPPEALAGVIQTALSLMAPKAQWQSPMGHVANAIGEGFAASGRALEMKQQNALQDEKLRQAQVQTAGMGLANQQATMNLQQDQELFPLQKSQEEVKANMAAQNAEMDLDKERSEIEKNKAIGGYYTSAGKLMDKGGTSAQNLTDAEMKDKIYSDAVLEAQKALNDPTGQSLTALAGVLGKPVDLLKGMTPQVLGQLWFSKLQGHKDSTEKGGLTAAQEAAGLRARATHIQQQVTHGLDYYKNYQSESDAENALGDSLKGLSLQEAVQKKEAKRAELIELKRKELTTQAEQEWDRLNGKTATQTPAASAAPPAGTQQSASQSTVVNADPVVARGAITTDKLPEALRNAGSRVFYVTRQKPDGATYTEYTETKNVNGKWFTRSIDLGGVQ